MKENIIYFFNKNKSIFKYIGLIILGLILMYWMIYLFTPKPQIPIELKNTIDSLSKVNIELEKQQQQLNSNISSFQSQIYDLDYAIGNIKEKTIVVREYYHKTQQQVNNYNLNQIDSFFKHRYKY